MSDPEEARRMLAIGRRDLRALAAMVDDPDSFPDEIFGFHAQQTVEKALKSWLCVEVGKYSKVHDLDQLLHELEDAGVPVPDSFLKLADFVDFAVQYRYSAFDEAGPLDRPQAVLDVTALLEHVEKRIRDSATSC